MRHYSILFAVLGLLLTVVSCKKNDYSSYPPTWKGFQFEHNGQTVNPRTGIFQGDKITVTAVQDQKGHLINATTYNWKVTAPVLSEDNINYRDTVIFARSVPTNYDYVGGVNPSIEFTLPQNALGTARLTFSATFQYSGSGIQVSDGGNYEQGSGISGSIHSTSGAIFGQSNGSVTFNIKER